MTDLDDLPWSDDSTPTRNGAKGRRPHRHSWEVRVNETAKCRKCSALYDEVYAASRRRGKSARNRGNAFEREVAAKLGGRRVGQYGDKVDVDVPGYLRAQCKVGAAYPERLDGWLRAIPVEAGILRAVVIGDAPGSSGKRRTLIVLDFDDFCDWYGNQ